MNAILMRLQMLGGDISQATGDHLIDDLQNIKFKTVLHFKSDNEPFYVGFYDNFYRLNHTLARSDPNAFIDKAIMTHYVSVDDECAVGQAFWQTNKFTPLTYGTADFDEWHDDFEEMDLSPFLKATKGRPPEFLQILYSYGYPDCFFICLNDDNQSDPMVFGADHEQYFDEVSEEGRLSEFLAKLMSVSESRDVIKNFLDDVHADDE